ncbi:MAG: cardiolipin synthase [Calditerrivibrio sp.]|nr:cardiolipin synthase [Calditerrivibrio sp.]
MKIFLFVEYLFNIAAILLILYILLGKKEPRATFSWMIALVFVPVLGVLLYIFIGRPRLRRIINIKLNRNPYILRDNKVSDRVIENKFCNMVCSITKKPPMSLDCLELLESAATTYSRLANDILGAEKYIFFQYYIIRNDETGKFFLNLLTHKLNEGVKVYILYDWVGSIGMIRSRALKEFVSKGGKAAPFLSPLSFKTFSLANFRNHRKLVVIDGNICYTGGINIGNEYLGKFSGMDEWIDCHVRFAGEAVIDMGRIFCEDWYYCTKEDLTNHLIEYRQEGCNRIYYSHVIPSGPDQKINFIYESLLSIFSKAQESITIITPYLVPDETMINVLKNISLLGIKVKIILPGKNNHPIVGAAGRSYYEELMESGIEIYETKYMLHSKIVLIDNSVVSTGTVNMDNRSMKLNFEVSLLVYSEEFAKHVNSISLNYISIAKRLDLDTIRALPKYKKIFDGLCRAFSPIL